MHFGVDVDPVSSWHEAWCPVEVPSSEAPGKASGEAYISSVRGVGRCSPDESLRCPLIESRPRFACDMTTTVIILDELR